MQLIGDLYNAAGKLTGGPSALSNGITSALLLGGAGYGAGKLMSKFAPDDYVDGEALSRQLGLLGALGGAATAIPHGYYNSVVNRKTTGDPAYFKSFFAGNKHQPAFEQLSKIQADAPEFVKKSREILKTAAFATGVDALYQPIEVDAFNRAIWRDVHNGVNSTMNNPFGSAKTPPAVGAAASGLVSGIQSMYGGSNILTPRHFIHGLAGAGVDYATARLAGGALGALGILKPPAQKKLQQMGLWGGLIRGVTSIV